MDSQFRQRKRFLEVDDLRAAFTAAGDIKILVQLERTGMVNQFFIELLVEDACYSAGRGVDLNAVERVFDNAGRLRFLHRKRRRFLVLLDELVAGESQGGHVVRKETNAGIARSLSDHLDRDGLHAGIFGNGHAVIEIETDKSATLPTQGVEDEEGARRHVNVIGNLAERALGKRVDLLLAVSYVLIFYGELALRFFAVGTIDRVPGIERVLGVKNQVPPHAGDQRSRRRQIGIEECGDGRELFGRERALLVAAVNGRKSRVGADAVLPVRTSVANNSGKLGTVALVDIAEIIGERGDHEFGIRVLRIPLLHEIRFAQLEIRVFELTAVHQDGIRLVIRRFKSLEERGKRLLAIRHLRRQVANEIELRVLPGICHQHLLAIGTLPPERRFRVPVAVEKNRSAIAVGSSGEVFQSQCAQNGWVGPRLARNVGDIRVIERNAPGAMQRVREIGGTNQFFEAGVAGEQVRVLRGNADLPFSNEAEELFLRRGIAGGHVILNDPRPIKAEAHVGMVRNVSQQFVNVSGLNLRDLRLQIRVADVEVGVRDKIDGPFAGGQEGGVEAPAPSIHSKQNMRFRRFVECAHIERESLLAKVIGSGKRGAKVLIADEKFHAAVLNLPRQRDRKTGLLVKLASLLAKKDGGIQAHRRRKPRGRSEVLREANRVVDQVGKTLGIGGSIVHGGERQCIFAHMKQGSGQRNLELRFAINGRVNSIVSRII